MNVISLECPACFSLRRVSPIQSPLQVIEVPGGRALSTDGIHWQIQLLAEVRAMEISGAERVGQRYFAYGHWMAATGFVRVPASPTLGDQDHNPSLRPLLETLATRPKLPFPTGDHMELWLLDRFEKLPLALLRSAARGTLLPVLRDADWLPTAHGDTSFVSPSLAGTAAGRSPWPHRDILSRRVLAKAGFPASAQWFLRDSNGNGMGLGGMRVSDELRGRHLSAAHFPELLLRTDWDDPTDRSLVSDFHHWQAPLLLTLSGLRPDTRERLERAACRRPMELFRVRHLLPEVANPDLIKVPLVEAALHSAFS